MMNLLECRPGRTLSKRSVFPDPEALVSPCRLGLGAGQVLYLPWPQGPVEMLACGQRASTVIEEHPTGPLSLVVATSLFSSTHYPSVEPSFDKLLRAVVIATGRPADALGDHFLTEFLGVLSQKKVGPSLNGCLSLQTCKLQRPLATSITPGSGSVLPRYSFRKPKLKSLNCVRCVVSTKPQRPRISFLCFWFSNTR